MDKDARIKELEDRNERILAEGRLMLNRMAAECCNMEQEWHALELQNSKLMEFIKRNRVIDNPAPGEKP